MVILVYTNVSLSLRVFYVSLSVRVSFQCEYEHAHLRCLWPCSVPMQRQAAYFDFTSALAGTKLTLGNVLLSVVAL